MKRAIVMIIVALLFVGVVVLSMFLCGARSRDENDYGFVKKTGFEIIEEGKAIKCLECERVSWHPEDVRQRYCGNCHKFHEAVN